MPIYDATLPVREGMVTFPGDPPFKMEPYFQRSQGDPFNLAVMCIGTHLGTHVDPPAHYLDGGATVDQLPLDALVGPGLVLDMRGRAVVDREALELAGIDPGMRLLLKTDNSPFLAQSEFREDYVYLWRLFHSFTTRMVLDEFKELLQISRRDLRDPESC